MSSRPDRIFLVAAAALALCLRINAQANAPPSPIIIHVHKAGLFSAFGHDHVITAPIASGTLDAKAMTVEITVDTKQMKVADPDVSEKDRAEIQATMLGPKVLDAEKYPEIRFRSSRVEQMGAQRYRVTGRLELHGASRDLSFDVSGGPDRFQGKTRLKQRNFGIEPVSFAGGTVKVKDEVEIEFDVHAKELAASRVK